MIAKQLMIAITTLLFAPWCAVAEPVYLHECHANCGSFGECIPDTQSCDDIVECGEYICLCQKGYTGEDCSLRAPAYCGDNHQCFNGGVCTGANGCDCSLVYGSNTKNIDPQCRFTVTDICEEGKDQSSYAYCYNNGICLKQIESRSSNNAHPGCNCDGTGYTGSHCQFPVANDPNQVKEERTTGIPLIVQEQGQEKKQGRQGKKPKALISIIVLIFVAGMGVVARRFLQRERCRVEMKGSCANSNDISCGADETAMPDTASYDDEFGERTII